MSFGVQITHRNIHRIEANLAAVATIFPVNPSFDSLNANKQGIRL